ncbi:hypothetical protein [Actinophytocola sp.]|uniref:hypothetical protein n=1 Tax=Actinophytocola sp. TaxID=1872138 RepID=UPI0025C5A4A8|nr:hypothetical protein [Actinophytocola sp.]
MDSFGADIIASSRRADLAADAEQSRLARASRECQEKSRPAPRPERSAVRARRAVAV